MTEESVLEELLPEERQELERLLVGLSDKQRKRKIRDYKLSLDCPELSELERQPLPKELFTTVQQIAGDLWFVIDDVDKLEYTSLHPNAKAFLSSQLKKSIGILVRVVKEFE